MAVEDTGEGVAVAAAAIAAGEALASASAALAAPGVQEDVSSALLAEFLKDSRKKEKLLWSQLRVVDALQGFLEHVDMPVNTEEEIRAEAGAAQQLWKDLRAEHQKQVEAIEAAVPKALEQLEAGKRKQASLGSALRQARAKRRALEEWRNVAQAQRRREQEKRRQRLEAGAQAQREHLEKANKRRAQALTLQYEEQKSAQRLGTFLGLLEMLHGAEGDGGSGNLFGSPASLLQ
ncbi:ZW10 interactor-like [Trichosurus vulpecula]|uniref:ZW10 interactor-like n=1 Tax=Trichosurus vulpecula TaxID=9337 RepID=UPI00186AC83F|nr:ZW10 interactor-like [Trichosurus vulpecula]